MFKTKKLITLSILSAIGTILMYIEIPSPIIWLKFDLSDVVVYLGAMIYGPIGAVIVAFIKSIIHFFVKGSPVGIPIDQFIAFIASLAYALPLYYLTKLFKKREHHPLIRYSPLILSTLFMALFMTTINYWLTDIYIRMLIINDITKINTVSQVDVMNTVQGYLGFSLPSWIENSSFLPKDIWLWFIILTYIPFNLAKGALTSITYFILSYRLDYLIKRFQISEGEESLLLQLSETE